MRGNKQGDSRRDEHRANDGDNGEEFAAAVFLQLEVRDDFPVLFVGDKPGFVQFLNVGVFHIRSPEKPRDEAGAAWVAGS